MRALLPGLLSRIAAVPVLAQSSITSMPSGDPGNLRWPAPGDDDGGRSVSDVASIEVK